MLQLVNLSNYIDAVNMVNSDADLLQHFLQEHNLDGLEIMLCEPWDEAIFKREFIKGSHLWFWNDWLDFWREDMIALTEEYKSIEKVALWYGGLKKDKWLDVYRNNIKTTARANPKYMVFHVSNARFSELYNRQFNFSDEDVINATIELVNLLVDDIPSEVEILFENLWWPGMTLLNKDLVGLLLEKVKHPKCGIMLDTGHLMNTCVDLKSEDEGVEYILKVLQNLGEYKDFVRGIHLSSSLSGEYVIQSQRDIKKLPPMEELFYHVKQIDQHLPFKTSSIKKVVDFIKPEYLVHEFIVSDIKDWSEKIKQQQKVLYEKSL